MAFAFKIGFVWYCLCSLVVCHSGHEVTTSFEIVRGKYDTFRNLQCQKSRKHHECTSDQCESYRAECEDNECERCQCNKNGRGTFLASRSNTGNCTEDENIIPESVPNQSFRLENIINDTKLTNQCLTVAKEQNYNIYGKSCTSSLNMHWILIEKRIEHQSKNQLMNVMTLQCLEFLTSTLVCKSNDENQTTSEVALKQCNKTDGQYITVEGRARTIHSICGNKRYYLRLKKKQNDVGYPAFSERNKPDRWTNSEENDLHLYKRPSTYGGCYRFQNEEFILYLDNETCRENSCSHQFFAPILSDNTECRIEWSESSILYGGPEWQIVSQNIDQQLVSIENKSDDINMLRVDQKALKIFNGSLLKLNISCRNEMNMLVENHCLLLKFKSLDSLPKKTKPKTKMTTTSSTMTTSSKMTTSSTMAISSTMIISSTMTTSSKMITSLKMTTSSTMTTSPTTTSPTVKLKNKDTEGSSINTTAIAVPVSLLAIILVLIFVCFVCYRKKKRRQKLSNDQGNMSNPNYSRPAYEDPNRMYEMLAVPGNQKATPATYEYIDNNDIAKPKQPQPELKYDYATNTEIPRINLNTQPKSGGDADQPELKYDYAENTDIPRITLDTKPGAQGPAGQPELKYDYATNTEIPRITLDTLPKAEGVADQPELKYYYATNTEIPRINLNPHPKSDDAVDPSGNPMYHTLEEPNPPPYYSTLEKPAAETNPLVTYDTPHSGDPMYHVLGDSNDENSQP